MLINAKHLKGLEIQATDGQLGTVQELYYEDETWAIRYFTVDTGGWLSGRQVLISPISVVQADWPCKKPECQPYKEAGGEQSRHRHSPAGFPAARGRLPRLLWVPVLLGRALSLGYRLLPGGTGEFASFSTRIIGQNPNGTWRRAFAHHRGSHWLPR